MNVANQHFSEKSGGVLEVLYIAAPLIISALGHTVNMFVDRLMLSWHSQDEMSAAMPAGITAFTLACFFYGVIGYAGTFVAQYVGAHRNDRVGTAVWQGIFLALIGGLVMSTGYFFGPLLFDLFPHDEAVRVHEITYFQLMMAGAILPMLSAAFCNFWAGRGKTKVIMIVNLIGTGVNIGLNYLLIFGFTFYLPGYEMIVPGMGIFGAGVGTIITNAIMALIYATILFSKPNREKFNTLRNPWDIPLFKRMIRFGTPNGVMLFLDLAAFNTFVILMGCFGGAILAATGVAFSMNMISFIPLLGLSQAASILVGQSVGEKNIPHAVRSVRSSFLLTFGYTFCMVILFVFYPEPILQLFYLEDAETIALTRKMLYFMAAWLTFDGIGILYSSAIRGAGDTKFAMYIGAGMAWTLFAIPCLIAFYFGASVWTLWTMCVIYVIIVGTAFYARYRSGKWKSMRVIEDDVTT